MAYSKRTFVIALASGLTLVGSLFSTAGALRADTLLIDTMGSAQSTATDRPARGSSMASVEARFGPPTTRSRAVGKPPITRWDYGNFAVFFEYDHVVHSVRR